MFLSVFDIFKIGVGPSSSHTMGPMTAAARFLADLRGGRAPVPGARGFTRLSCSLHGSLAFTGKGHGTDRAVVLGLMGFTPDTLDPDAAETLEAEVRRTKRITPPGLPTLEFDPDKDIIFDFGPALPGHANGMKLMAHDAHGNLYLTETYYSIGGGFVVTEAELGKAASAPQGKTVPYPFRTANEMMAMAAKSGKTIAQMKRANELVYRSPEALDAGLMHIWSVMKGCMDRGLRVDGILPGGLKVRRRAKSIHDQLRAQAGRNDAAPHVVNDWISLYAMAVNEENAAGGRVVTSPTNGAAGVVPAVIRYWLDHVPGAQEAQVGEFLLVAAAIGGIIKHNASISGAEAGCQAEVGSASAMAAAGLCAVLGGTTAQIENAAEIALEHHLGMSCDPVAGLVQVPCIERNGLGAVKAVTAASLALRGDGQHFVPLDACIRTMYETGQDLHSKYKETSTGGLATNVAIPEC